MNKTKMKIATTCLQCDDFHQLYEFDFYEDKS